jgi:hypothetical protein
VATPSPVRSHKPDEQQEEHEEQLRCTPQTQPQAGGEALNACGQWIRSESRSHDDDDPQGETRDAADEKNEADSHPTGVDGYGRQSRVFGGNSRTLRRGRRPIDRAVEGSADMESRPWNGSRGTTGTACSSCSAGGSSKPGGSHVTRLPENRRSSLLPQDVASSDSV